MWRPGSPSPGGSTLITSAPWSAITCERCGPGQEQRQVEDAHALELHQAAPRARSAAISRVGVADLAQQRVGVLAERRARAALGRRSPSSLIGFASTRKSGRAGCGSVAHHADRAQRTGCRAPAAGRRPARRAAGPAAVPSHCCGRAARRTRRRAPRSARRDCGGARPTSRSRGSVARSARPSSPSSACQNFSVMHMTKIQPSRVRNSCTGTADGCELRGRRSVRWPSFRYQLPG